MLNATRPQGYKSPKNLWSQIITPFSWCNYRNIWLIILEDICGSYGLMKKREMSGSSYGSPVHATDMLFIITTSPWTVIQNNTHCYINVWDLVCAFFSKVFVERELCNGSESRGTNNEWFGYKPPISLKSATLDDLHATAAHLHAGLESRDHGTLSNLLEHRPAVILHERHSRSVWLHGTRVFPLWSEFRGHASLSAQSGDFSNRYSAELNSYGLLFLLLCDLLLAAQFGVGVLTLLILN